ncbi:MAG TPA: hypothetical protein VIF43_00015 [Patescibacteria group bacterium]|jgi:hypothetical protein
MSLTVEQLEAVAAEAVPDMEQELGKVRGFTETDPELRLRIYGGCTIASETFRQLLTAEGAGGGLMRRDLPEPLHGEHVLLTVDTDDGLAVLDGTYAQLLEPFGPSWREATEGVPVTFPDARVLAFRDGEQESVAEWAVEVAAMHDPHVDRAAAYDFFRGIWDLSHYRDYKAPYYTRKFAGRLSAQLAAKRPALAV